MEPDWGDKLDVRYYLIKQLRSIKKKRILDIGCGKGYVLKAIDTSCQKYGVEIDSKSLAMAKKTNPSAMLKKASMYSLPFPANSFDVVIMANVVPVADFSDATAKRSVLQKRALKEATRVLAKEGVLFLTTPNNAYYQTIKMEKKELERLLRGLTYELSGWNPFPPFPYFLPARVLRYVPGWFALLSFLCRKRLFVNRSKFFYAECRKN